MPVPQRFSAPADEGPTDAAGKGDHAGGAMAGDSHNGELPPGASALGIRAEPLARPESRSALIARIKRTRPVQEAVPVETPNSMLDAQLQQQLSSDAAAGISIERPRSALHSGDFRGGQDASFEARPAQQAFGTSPPAPWLHPFRTGLSSGLGTGLGSGLDILSDGTSLQGHAARSRAFSQSSLSSSFAYRPPTSPLALNSDSIDFDSGDERRARQDSPTRSSRRCTFSPGALRNFSAPLGQSLGQLEHAAHATPWRYETFPRQAHQPRRSISSLHSFTAGATPARSRRASLLSEGSPRGGANMVGGYEESIIRGRMSTLPSRPLDFVAQIGVLGRGDCKPSLRCPKHILVPFPAVFYDYGSADGRSGDGPSPYVGLVDLESRQTKSSRPDAEAAPADEWERSTTRPAASSRSQAPRGGYRIPQQGQLQIVIKNPHKTAVKLFLVPYDLADMLPGQKTFIRQRSYSAGPIVDLPAGLRKVSGGSADRPETAAPSTPTDPGDRPMLRYLIHLHICCSRRGRFYLYKSVRVVFANRVPDGKEKLRNQVQLPEPRYTTYRPDGQGEGAGDVGEQAESPLTGRHDADALAEVFGSEPRARMPMHAMLADRRRSTGFSNWHTDATMTIPETSSNGSHAHSHSSSKTSDQKSSDGAAFVLDGQGGEAVSPGTIPDNTNTNPNDTADHDLVVTRTRSPVPAPRARADGLLALQLRDWRENGGGALR